MAVAEAAVFWSYAHEDDAFDQGSIRRLAERIKAEFALITGEELALFVDREDILWGEEWRSRIDTALKRTTFFVPVLSPRYFTRDECRRELLDFAGQAQALGVVELILPVLYVAISDFTSENPDEVVALASRMQYEDWTDLRLFSDSSPEHRRAVNGLASRLAEIARTVAARQMDQEHRAAKSDESESTTMLADVLSEIGELLPAWLDAVETDSVLDAQYKATHKRFAEMISKAKHRGPSVRFSLEQRRASEFIPIAERQLELAETYSAKTIAMNPLVRRSVRLIEDHPDSLPLFNDLVAAVDEAVGQIRLGDWEPGKIFADDWARQNRHISRAMGLLAEIWKRSNRLRLEGNAIVLEWQNSLHRLRC